MMKIASACIIFLGVASVIHTKAQMNPVAAADLDTLTNRLFESDEILDLTLRGDIGSLLKDRTGEPQYFSMAISYFSSDSTPLNHDVKVRTRGHFRRLKSNCDYPPLLLNFSKENIPSHSVFANQGKLKLVTPCSDDKYVIREYLVYKLYNLLTVKSYKARLVRVTYEDTIKHKKTPPLYGILLENDDHLAARNASIVIEDKVVKPYQTDSETFFTTAVFEYMIANTDWSVQFRQNITLIAKNALETPLTVPYDFDHAGIVSTPYAKPAEELEMSSVRERRYRGYCITDMKKFNDTFALFNREKSNIYSVYTNNQLLLGERYVKTTMQFLDEFYSTINNEKAIQRVFSYPCDADGTGNIVIKGLN
jgi:hypothetical protein